MSSTYLEVEHAGRGGRGDVLATADLEESCPGEKKKKEEERSVNNVPGLEKREKDIGMRRNLRYGGFCALLKLRLTVKLQELVVAGLAHELLGVHDRLLEGIALRGRHGGFVGSAGLVAGGSGCDGMVTEPESISREWLNVVWYLEGFRGKQTEVC